MKDKNFSAPRLVRKALRKHFPNREIHVSHDVTEKGLHIVTGKVKAAISSMSAERLRARFNHPNGRAEVADYDDSTVVRFEYTPIVRVK